MIQDRPSLRDAIYPTELLLATATVGAAPGDGVWDVLRHIHFAGMDPVLKTWAHTLAVLHRSAPAHPAPWDDPGPAPSRSISRAPLRNGKSVAPGPRQVSLIVIDLEGGRWALRLLRKPVLLC
ncbi:hypothetical protein AB0F91_45590 [Amycolatopsis sp. NPDC023774]|uniref:hypothetical protein n=1 Tax=Amycolatopsis sp. NPDC023774 TaxID=3155015 RepID=UPI0033F92812